MRRAVAAAATALDAHPKMFFCASSVAASLVMPVADDDAKRNCGNAALISGGVRTFAPANGLLPPRTHPHG